MKYGYDSINNLTTETESINGSVRTTSYAYDNDNRVTSITTGSMATTLGVHNPLRYRGYVYDQEYGLYYLQSRYYNPAIGRFINADNYSSTGQGLLGNNTFAYCLNNPVMLCDPTGDIAITTLILIGSAVLGLAATAYSAYTESKAGFDTVQIVGDSLCVGLSAFMIIYSGGIALYQCYQNYCYLNAITPVTNIGSPSIEENLQRCADTANSSISGSGPVIGSRKHSIFANEVNNSLLRTEVSYKDGSLVPYGTRGSIRFDVMLYDSSGSPLKAWDFKTGNAILTPKRIAQMQQLSGLEDIEISTIR